MKTEYDIIMHKMVAVISTAQPQHKESVTNFIKLSNRRLHSLSNKNNFGAIAGGSAAIKESYERKFGKWI